MPWQCSFGIIFLSEARPPAVRAPIMMIICCDLIAASTFGAKVLGRGELGAPMHAFQITFGRYFFALCVLTTAAFFLPVGRPKVSLPLYAARTFCGWAGVSGLFAAAALQNATRAHAPAATYSIVVSLPPSSALSLAAGEAAAPPPELEMRAVAPSPALISHSLRRPGEMAGGCTGKPAEGIVPSAKTKSSTGEPSTEL